MEVCMETKKEICIKSKELIKKLAKTQKIAQKIFQSKKSI